MQEKSPTVMRLLAAIGAPLSGPPSAMLGSGPAGGLTRIIVGNAVAPQSLVTAGVPGGNCA